VHEIVGLILHDVELLRVFFPSRVW